MNGAEFLRHFFSGLSAQTRLRQGDGMPDSSRPVHDDVSDAGEQQLVSTPSQDEPRKAASESCQEDGKKGELST